MTLGRVGRWLSASALAVALLWAPASVWAAPGALDPAFGTAGKVAENYGYGGETRDLALGPDGSIAVAVTGGGYWGVARLLKDGARDTNFENGIAGWKSGRFAGLRADESVEAVLIQPDKMIVAGGTTYPDDAADPFRRDFGLVRLRPDAEYDATFGVGGTVTTRLRHATLRGIALQPDGKIVAVGESLPAAGDSNIDVTVVRYMPDGALDPEFGDGGVVITPNPGADSGRAVAFDQLGRIVVAGSAGSEKYFAVSRYLPDGRLDPTFAGGRVQFARGVINGFNGVAVQPDGHIVAAGYRTVPDEDYDFEPTVVRLTALGLPDPTFGDAGEALIRVRGRQVLHDVALQPDGKIVAVGGSETPSAAYLDWQKRDFGIYRLDATGRLDSTFATNGVQRTDWFGGLDDARALALGPDGRITVGGSVPRVDGAVARYLGDPVLPPPASPDPLSEEPKLPPEAPGNQPQPPGNDAELPSARSEGTGASDSRAAVPVPADVVIQGTPPLPAAPGNNDLSPAPPFRVPVVQVARLEMTKRGLRATLRCASTASCHGRISVRHRRTKLGATRFRVPARALRRVTMRVPSVRLRQLRKRAGLRLVARVDVPGAKPRTWRSSVP